jgi:hypothetical protein
VGDVASSSGHKLLYEGIHIHQQRVQLCQHGTPENRIGTSENAQPAISGRLHI